MSEKNFHEKRINNPRYIYLANACLEALGDRIENIKSMIDLGSSCAPLLNELSKLHKFDRLVGIDASEYAKELWMCPEGKCYIEDLSKPLKEETIKELGQFDLITSFETAEHLEKDQSFVNLIDKIAHNNSVLIFSAAIPGQKGRGHINCQLPIYWIDKFHGTGWEYDHLATSAFIYYAGKVNHRKDRFPLYYCRSLVFKRNVGCN